MRMRRHGVVWFVAGCVLAVLTAAEQRDYEIVLTRPMSAGQRYSISVKAEMVKEMKATVQGVVRDRRNDRLVTRTEASVEVLEVDGNRQPSKVSITIRECAKTERGTAKPLLAKGSVVLASVKNGKTVFEVEGKEIEGEEKRALALVISLGSNQATADEAFGTSSRKIVGDSWPMKKAVAIGQLKENDQQVGEDDIEGDATLSGVVNVDGVECLKIASTMRMKNFAAQMPAGVTMDKSSMEVMSLSLFPVDTTLGRMEDQMKTVVDIVCRVRKDPSVPVMTVATRDTVDVKRKYSY